MLIGMNVSLRSVQLNRFDTEEHPHEMAELNSNISMRSLQYVLFIAACLTRSSQKGTWHGKSNVFPLGTAGKPLFGYYGFYLGESI